MPNGSMSISATSGAGACETGAGDRGGRRAQRTDDRASGVGQDDAGAAYAVDYAADDVAGGARNHEDTFGSREARRRNGSVGDAAFRSPHHLTSQAALVGGGTSPQPGEISLAHNGILFADELPEFGRSLLETLRQPMEDKVITVSRSKYTVQYPANFMLVASMNPCPCGYYNHPTKACVCSHGAVSKYLNRISGPMLDRIDLHIEVIPVDFSELSQPGAAESSAAILPAAWWLHGRFRPNVSPEHRYIPTP